MKTLFMLQFHSVLDVITNSSSELFIGLDKSKDLMVSLIKNVYPGYRGEYDEIKSIDELSNDELDTYIRYHYETWSNRHQKIIRNVINGFDYDEMYEQKMFGDTKYTTIRDRFVIDNRERIINSIDPNRKMFFLFSLDENPDWDKQDALSTIMTRYHLG